MYSTTVLIVALAWLAVFASAAIYDPLNVFCGSASCYEILGVERANDIKAIKKAYRKISLTEHPDKNKAANATQAFQRITKAYDVLTGNESRRLFDYYLDHPRDYFTVSGEHYFAAIPKSDVRVVIFFVLLLVSWFFHTIQQSKHDRYVKYLTHATANNLGLKHGGSKQTLELYRRTAERYEENAKKLKASGDKSAGKVKMMKDPLFLEIVKEVVAEVQIDGGLRKPHWRELLVVQLFTLPHTLFLWAVTYHRRYISKQPLPLSDQIEMARSRVGVNRWEDMPSAEQEKLLAGKIWEAAAYAAWSAGQQEAEGRRQKQSKGSKKKEKRQMEEEGEDYVE
ncbi:hypothetical protein B484DRAFT_448583 [Ochromonadaceae sp. CCMP2298]|nr:hypothetical protein B484DRAFT_448583 [Ochromonadaceae sp. CCMP2298]|mmetsp:Transcript_13552/g.29898  ORF Transcript_13552/g.29898 Transcript_13552/m.29898 type:complete len:339 (-) Transcript_13552:308-1324(-)